MKMEKILLILLLVFLLTGYSFGRGSGGTNSSNEEINRLLKELKKTGEGPDRVNILTKLGEAYLRSEPAKALDYARQGIKISEKINYQKGIADCLYLSGIFYFTQRNSSRALQDYIKSLTIRKKIGDKRGIADSYNKISFIHGLQGNYTLAWEYALKGLKISEKIGYKKGVARSYNLIAINYLSDQDDHIRALEYYFKSLNIFKELGDKELIAQLYNNIGDVHTTLGNLNRALEFHFKSLRIREELGNQRRISDSYNNIGNIYKIQGNYNRAMEYQLKSMRIREELGDKGRISGSYHSIATIYNETGMPKNSLDYLLKGLRLLEETNAKPYLLVFLKDISGIYATLKNYKKAFEYHRRYSELKEDIFNMEKAKEISSIRTKYEVEKKEAENESLKQKNRIQELSLEKRKNLITAFILSSGLMLILVFVTYNGYRLKKKSNLIIQAEKEKAEQANRAKGELLVKLEEKSGKLKVMDRVKSRFFANISHEFRTPLTLIIGPLEQVYNENRDRKLADNIKIALRNSQRMLTLINQLLDLSRLDSGDMQLQASRQNIIPFLKGVVGCFESLAAQMKLDLIFHANEEDISLYYDTEKLEKVIVNLLANAVKFTPAGGKITVTAAAHRAKEENYPTGYLNITVCDTGIGIPEDQLPYIFNRFYQADGYFSHEHKHKGSGIGLSLAKELVTLHHGDIHAASRQEQGTEFTLRLPLGKEHLKPEDIRADEIPTFTFDTRLAAVTEFEKYENAGNKEENHIETGTDGKDVILIVEDNPDVRQYIRGPLEAEYTVIEAADGEEGIEKARKIIPDLIISDVMMPRQDGFQLCNVLKKDIKTSHIPIILLTAKASEESVIAGLETGADDYITKPFNIKILLTRIKNLIDLRLRLQETIQREMLLQPTEIAVSSIDREFMNELKEAIEKNLGDMDFGVDELAQSLYMSRTHLNRKVRALTGESTNRFIQSYRLKRAAQLLKEKFGNVTDVAFQVGFSSSNYFTRCFKEKFHQLPHTYAHE